MKNEDVWETMVDQEEADHWSQMILGEKSD